MPLPRSAPRSTRRRSLQGAFWLQYGPREIGFRQRMGTDSASEIQARGGFACARCDGLRSGVMNAKFVGRVMALTSAVLAMLLPAVFAVAQQQEQFPTRPITLIVPFAPGGATDIVARLVAVHVGEDLGQSVVIDNRAGGAGNIGTHAAARANPDGYTLVLATTTQLINQYLSKSLPYNLFTDLVPIALIADAPEVIAISAKLPATTLSQFVAAARADVNGFNYGSAGLGSVPHLGGEVLARAVNAKMVHIPFRGSADAVKEVAAGHVKITPPTKTHVGFFC